MSLNFFRKGEHKRRRKFAAVFFIFSEMFFVYILFSDSLNQYYVGETDDLELRLIWHNEHYFEKAHTIKANDWKLIWSLQCDSRGQAKKIEAFIKRMKSRKFIERLIKETGDWLLKRFPSK